VRKHKQNEEMFNAMPTTLGTTLLDSTLIDSSMLHDRSAMIESKAEMV